MKVIEKRKATATLAAYADEIGGGPVVVTDSGKPVAVLVSLENADLETVSLSTNPSFIQLIERSRASVRKKGAIASNEMRRRFDRPSRRVKGEKRDQ
jgi:antitoxin (DNA-binding transcriptional repressor) of toxin-antitoxin stability system